ncbi:beta-1,4 N-acetylgalactosaminyltransferase 2-like [Branchiostoma floridae x Branchiostoma japonicum]
MVNNTTIREISGRTCHRLSQKRGIMSSLIVVVCFGTLLLFYQCHHVIYTRDINLTKKTIARSDVQRILGNRDVNKGIERKSVSQSRTSDVNLGSWERKVTVKWRNKTLRRLHRNQPCDCSQAVSNMYTTVDEEERAAFNQRRLKEVEKHYKRLEPSQERLYIVKGSVPLSYPVRGLTVVPEGTIKIPGLEVIDPIRRQGYKIQLEASKYGTLDVTAEVSDVQSEGLGEKSLTIRSRILPNINHQLQYIVYSNTVYGVGATEIIKFRYLNYEASIPVLIQPSRVSLLYDPGPGMTLKMLG